MFTKSKSIELGGIQPEFDLDINGHQQRRRSHADIEKLKRSGESMRPGMIERAACSEEFLETKEKRAMNGAAAQERAIITQDTLDKMREVELEDVLMNARNITEPDPTSNMSFCPRPARVIEGSFKHTVSVREVDSKTGAFRHRTIEILRNPEDELGFSVRKGDGWEKHDGIFVSRISLGSIFDKFELMRVGDEIVKINRIEMRNMEVDDVVRLMHIPEKLSITVKMLTPFSKKRTSKSNIANGSKKVAAKNKIDLVDTTNSNSSIYKIAHMKIGRSTDDVKKSTDNREAKRAEQASKDQSKKEEPVTTKTSTTATGRSPYRTGASQRQLSPIRETASEERMNKVSSALNVSGTRRTSVTWLDQRSFNSDPGR